MPPLRGLSSGPALELLPGIGRTSCRIRVMEEVSRIAKRRRRHGPWRAHRGAEAHAPDGNALHESVGEPAERRNVTLGVMQHLWRSPVPFIGFYPPEG